MTPVDSEIRRLLAEAKTEGRHLSKVALDADVSYDVVWNWLNGRAATLDVLIAERLYKTLTGQGFIK